MKNQQSKLIELLNRKVKLLEEWRDLYKRAMIRQAYKIGELQGDVERHREVLNRIIESGKVDDELAAMIASAQRNHPERLDAEWMQPALMPNHLRNGLLAQFSTLEEAEEVAAAYAGSEPEFMLGTWNTKLGARAPEGEDLQYWAHLFVLANPDYRPAQSAPTSDGEEE